MRSACAGKSGVRSILEHGDLSVLSFHATKVFNTFEGGAIICPDAKTKQRIDHLKNFGFVDEVTVVARRHQRQDERVQRRARAGCSSSTSTARIARRGAIDGHYRALLAGVPGMRLLDGRRDATPNNSYFPILVGPDYRARPRRAVRPAARPRHLRPPLLLPADLAISRCTAACRPPTRRNLPVARAPRTRCCACRSTRRSPMRTSSGSPASCATRPSLKCTGRLRSRASKQRVSVGAAGGAGPGVWHCLIRGSAAASAGRRARIRGCAAPRPRRRRARLPRE